MAVDDRVKGLLSELSEARYRHCGTSHPPCTGAAARAHPAVCRRTGKRASTASYIELHGDVRNLLYGLIGGFLLLAGGGWVAYDKLSDQIRSGRDDVAAVRTDQAKALGEAQTQAAIMNGKLDMLMDRKTPAPKR